MNGNENKTCPDPETLSAYFDKEIQLDEKQLEHIKNCRSCSSFLKICSHINSAVVHSADDVYSDDMPEHILSETKRMIIKDRLDESRKKYGFTFRRWIPRIVALFIFSGVLGYILYINGYFSSDITPDSPVPPSGFYISYQLPEELTFNKLEDILHTFAKTNNLAEVNWILKKGNNDNTITLDVELEQAQYSALIAFLQENGLKHYSANCSVEKPSTEPITIKFLFSQKK